MTCSEAQSYITPFINDELDSDLLEDFLIHIEKCADCKEELEVYYTLLTGMKQLDEERNLPSDFHLAFVNKLKREEEKIINKKIISIRKRVVLILVICVISFLSSIGIREYVVGELKEVEKQEEGNNYVIKNYFYLDKETTLDKFIEKNKNEILNYKKQFEYKNESTDKGEQNE
ncbi:putative zinc finger protein [Mobilisporobacter senegalensis]|uniref:Putative zinc finger protein n=1 Tax=Mobilisporobacter senegalensis TaxID=1329262 RepID=A0A3N1XT71_9FIRM|nr:zf-HC2 domain-containing protein [Mobilisporobacter senegalensis]ROR29361.1 putative zinc finger protein [Mobilisporobacter senegalensis]